MSLWSILCWLSFFMIILTGCVERGKPIKKENKEQQVEKTGVKKIKHYICKNGHEGSDEQGVCTKCNIAFIHNQAYHGLSIPKDAIKDPFQTNTNSSTNSTPAQNIHGDYHYICPNGHAGGSGSAGTCTTCAAKLIHNQLYHK